MAYPSGYRFTSNGGGGSDPFGGGGPRPSSGGFTPEKAGGWLDVGERIAGYFGIGGESQKKQGKALVARNEPATDCPTGTIKVMGRCIAPGDAFPGGDPFITQAGGQTRMGAFGMPAVTPVQEQRVHRSCPSGMVLGKDNLCYPRAVLPRRSRFRKWRPGMKPLLTGGDRKAIRKAESVANKLMGEKKRLRKAKNALNKVL